LKPASFSGIYEYIYFLLPVYISIFRVEGNPSEKQIDAGNEDSKTESQRTMRLYITEERNLLNGCCEIFKSYMDLVTNPLRPMWL
jgi:hypothetical protein